MNFLICSVFVSHRDFLDTLDMGHHKLVGLIGLKDFLKRNFYVVWLMENELLLSFFDNQQNILIRFFDEIELGPMGCFG